MIAWKLLALVPLGYVVWVALSWVIYTSLKLAQLLARERRP